MFKFSDLWHDTMLLFGKKPKEISLLVHGIYWCNTASWIERLIAYKQLEFWISEKHITKYNPENNDT